MVVSECWCEGVNIGDEGHSANCEATSYASMRVLRNLLFFVIDCANPVENYVLKMLQPGISEAVFGSF